MSSKCNSSHNAQVIQMFLNQLFFLTLYFCNVHNSELNNLLREIINRTLSSENLVSKHFIDLKHAHMADKKVSLFVEKKQKEWDRTWSADKHLLASMVVLGLV